MPTFRVYLRDPAGRVPADSKTTTGIFLVALEAFRALVERRDLDGQALAAALTMDGKQLAYHRFDRYPGHPDWWRDRVDEVQPLQVTR